jgi:hypothetical protein
MIRMPIEYFKTKDFDRSLNAVIQGGGRGQKIATRVRSILGSVDSPNPFKGIPVTNHGENRIPHCFKYDLGDGWRLVTQQSDKAMAAIGRWKRSLHLMTASAWTLPKTTERTMQCYERLRSWRLNRSLAFVDTGWKPTISTG